ncbi:hypothetical protein [Ferrimonas marina]|uniref:Uncharacterized protein n=1 Tax=Ferrimonas marina TaxID=299255 RepID=A0A1M5UDM9_9GAMM|nr:hypothetical protein [Ferrimonas marina]SHH60926.1 hypothetical protein SAMN02745129_2512 [Ferrimonas marina]
MLLQTLLCADGDHLAGTGTLMTNHRFPGSDTVVFHPIRAVPDGEGRLLIQIDTNAVPKPEKLDEVPELELLDLRVLMHALEWPAPQDPTPTGRSGLVAIREGQSFSGEGRQRYLLAFYLKDAAGMLPMDGCSHHLYWSSSDAHDDSNQVTSFNMRHKAFRDSNGMLADVHGKDLPAALTLPAWVNEEQMMYGNNSSLPPVIFRKVQEARHLLASGTLPEDIPDAPLIEALMPHILKPSQGTLAFDKACIHTDPTYFLARNKHPSTMQSMEEQRNTAMQAMMHLAQG